MSQATESEYIERYKDVFDATHAQNAEKAPDTHGWVDDDNVTMLVPEDMDRDGAIHPPSLDTKPESVTVAEYENDDGDNYELVEISHPNTYSRHGSTVTHYFKVEYVEKIANVFNVPVDDVVRNLESRYDRGNCHLAVYRPDCDGNYVLLIAPHTEP